MKAFGGLQLVSSTEHEHLLSYGPSPSFLKIEFSSVALNLFRAHGLTQIQLATYVAEWALIMGQASGRVNLAGDPLVLSGCYEYFRRQALQNSHVS